MKKFVSLSVLAASLLTAACGDPNAPPALPRYGFVVEVVKATAESCVVRYTRHPGPGAAVRVHTFWNVGTDSWQRSKFRQYEECTHFKTGDTFRLPASIA